MAEEVSMPCAAEIQALARERLMNFFGTSLFLLG